MKKAIIVSFFGCGNAGGVERVSQYISEILCSVGYEVRVMEAVRFHLPKFDYIFQAMLMSIRLCFVRKDIVVGNSWQAFLYPCDLSFAHGTAQGYATHLGEFRKYSGSGITAWMEKIAAKRAKKVLAVSAHVKDELVSLYKIRAEKIRVLPNCVDEGKFFPCEGRSKKDSFLLFSGRLERRKGLASLKSLSDFLETIDGWQLLIACNTKQNVELFEMNKKTHVYHGLSADDMPDFYRKGDILFFPSLYEGFSMATLEALSCGIPVLGTEFVVTQELSEFTFCKKIDTCSDNPAQILKSAEGMVALWQLKKDEIHQCTVVSFGKKAYAAAFLAQLDGGEL